MAQIYRSGQYTVVRWDKDDWYKGLLPTFGTSGTSTRPGPGFNDTTAIDPYRFPGYLSPGSNPVDATNVSAIDALLKNGVVNGTKAYAIGGAKLHEITIATNTVTNSGGTFPHTITPHGHSSCVGEDVLSYAINGVRCILYSWNDGTDGDIGKYDLSTGFDDDYMSTVATGGAVLNKSYPHPMIEGDDGVAYVGNGNNIAALDGRNLATPTWTAAALDLPAGYIATSFTKTANYLVIYAYRVNGQNGSAFYRAEATAFFWDYVSSSFTYAFPLAGNYVNGGFTKDGVPGCFVFGQAADGSAKQSKKMIFKGNGFEADVLFNDDIPGHGGVEVSGDSVLWNSAGTIYRDGAPFVGFEKALNKVAVGSGTTAGGMLKNFFNTQLLASTGTSTSGGLQGFSTDYAAGATVYTGQVQIPPRRSTGRYRVKSVRLNLRTTVSAGRGFRIALNTDNSPSATEAKGSLTYIYDSDTARSSFSKLSNVYYFDIATKALPLVSTALGLFLNWGSELPAASTEAPIIESVEVYLEAINL